MEYAMYFSEGGRIFRRYGSVFTEHAARRTVAKYAYFCQQHDTPGEAAYVPHEPENVPAERLYADSPLLVHLTAEEIDRLLRNPQEPEKYDDPK